MRHPGAGKNKSWSFTIHWGRTFLPSFLQAVCVSYASKQFMWGPVYLQCPTQKAWRSTYFINWNVCHSPFSHRSFVSPPVPGLHECCYMSYSGRITWHRVQSLAASLFLEFMGMAMSSERKVPQFGWRSDYSHFRSTCLYRLEIPPHKLELNLSLHHSHLLQF